MAILAGCARPEAPGAVPRLAVGTLLERELTAPQAHFYGVASERDDFLHLLVDQQGIDVVLRLLDHRGREILVVDSPNGARGPEHVFAVVDAPGEYRLEVRPWSETGTGGYRLELAEQRPASEEDRLRAAAAQALFEGDGLAGQQKPETLRRAIRRYKEALELWSEAGESYQQVVALAKEGRAWSFLGESQRAAERYEEALTLVLAMEVHEAEPSLLNDLGTAYRRLGEMAKAREVTRSALTASRGLSNPREETVALNNLALLLKTGGQAWNALDLYEEARLRFRELGDRDGEATALHNIGALYTWLERLPEARDALNEALRLRQSDTDRSDRAATLTALGWVELSAGNGERAEEILDRALALRRLVGDRHGEATTLDRLGTAYLESGEVEAALDAYQQALAISQELGDRKGEAHSRDNLGEAYLALGKPDSAREHLDIALRLHRQTGDRAGEAHVLVTRARSADARDDLSAALADFREAVEIFESLRAGFDGVSLRSSFFASVYEHYELYVDLLMRLNSERPGRGFEVQALEAVEHSRARSLLDLLGEAHRRGVDDDAAPSVGLETVGKELRALEARRLDAGGSADQVERLEAEIREQLRLREKLLAENRSVTGESIAVPEALGLEKIRGRVLDPETTLVVYSLGEERSYVWVIGPDDVLARELGPRAKIEGAAIRLHRLLAESHLRGKARQARLSAAALSEMILKPIVLNLRTPRLVVIPDGALSYIPFAALPLPGRQPEKSASLIEDVEIVVLPSASVLAAQRRVLRDRRPASHLLAMVADPVYRLDDDRIASSAAGDDADGGLSRLSDVKGAAGDANLQRSSDEPGASWLRRLPHTGREAETVLALVPQEETWRVLGFEASRESFLREGLSRYRILHFATHAVLNSEHPELSGIALSLVDRQGKPVDGFLRAFEIAGLDLSAELVVLSGCRTALGREIRGEGMVGLPQSFLHAGAARVVVSLWNVDDEATSVLMERFYRNLLEKGLSPPSALRAAQLSMLEEERWRAPYYWAAFVLVGEWRPIPG